MKLKTLLFIDLLSYDNDLHQSFLQTDFVGK